LAPLALVHGNPETPAVWDQLARSLKAAGRDPVRLSPPGFGPAMPRMRSGRLMTARITNTRAAGIPHVRDVLRSTAPA
jgi:hypothetical protein